MTMLWIESCMQGFDPGGMDKDGWERINTGSMSLFSRRSIFPAGHKWSPGWEVKTPNPGNHSIAYVGFNLLLPGNVGSDTWRKMVALYDLTDEQIAVYVKMDAAGRYKFRVQRGATVLATTGDDWLPNFWRLFEVYFKLDTTGSNGEVEIKLDSISELSVTGIDTTDAASTVWNKVYFNNNYVNDPNVFIDSITINNDAGSLNNGYIGERQGAWSFPNANGNRNEWESGPTMGDPTHYNKVNNRDDDTSFVQIANDDDGKVELYGYDNVGTPANWPMEDPIKAVLYKAEFRMDTAGSMDVKSILRNGGGTEVYGATRTISIIDSYIRHNEMFEQDPTISAAWTITNFNAMQYGFESVV